MGIIEWIVIILWCCASYWVIFEKHEHPNITGNQISPLVLTASRVVYGILSLLAGVFLLLNVAERYFNYSTLFHFESGRIAGAIIFGSILLAISYIVGRAAR